MLYNVIRAILSCVYRIMFKIEIIGLENIPQGERLIIAPNHMSNFDPQILGVFLPIDMGFMAKESLFKIPLFGRLLKALGAFPIKRGGLDLSAIKTALKILKSNKALMIFPEGKRIATPGVLGEGKHGAAMLAIKAQAGVLPVGIDATYKFRSKVTVKVGKVIDLSEYYGEKLNSEELQKITDEKIMTQIAKLAGARLYGN